MNNKLFNIENIVEALKANNIKKIVISPGGTNIPLIKQLQGDSFFTCYSVVDERSAMYFAIGLYLKTGEVIATSCTSAQATRNYIPGLTEAYYKNVPILAITMSKHPRFTYQGYMQGPDQTSLPKDCVKKSYSLPFIADDYDKLHSMRAINEAMLEVTTGVPGPVQLNVPWLDFPIKYEVNTFKAIGFIEKTQIDFSSLKNKKVLLVIGESRPFDKDTTELINVFSNSTNCVVYTNHLSNFHGENVVRGNLLLTCMSDAYFEKELMPDILITIGGQTGDYPLYRKLSAINYKSFEHWHVSMDLRVKDTYDHLTLHIHSSICDFFKSYDCSINEESHDYLKAWRDFEKEINRQVTLPFSNASCARKMAGKIPPSSIVNFAILNSMRVWSWFNIHPSIECYSTVSAFGIDGGTSMLIGESIESNQLCFLFTGDLAFYYDINALGIRHIKNNVRIMIVNNSGGVEFKYKSNSNAMPIIDKYIAAAGHYKNAKGWAEDCGFIYISAKTENEFDDAIDTFVSVSNKPIVLEVFVLDQDEATAYKKMLNNNLIIEKSEMIKNKFNRVLTKTKKIING